MQNDLKWNKHVESIVKKASKGLFSPSQLKRANIPSTDLVRFYVTCIRSTILHACQLFHFSFLDYLCFSLERVQKQALKVIIAFDTSYNNSLELAGQNKLSEQRSEHCDSFCLSILQIPIANCQCYSTIIQILQLPWEISGNLPFPSVKQTVLEIPFYQFRC